MKSIFVLFLIVLINLSSSEKEHIDGCKELNSFLTYFKQIKIYEELDKYENIPKEVYNKVLLGEDNIIDEYVVAVNSIGLLINQGSKVLIFETMESPGGYSSSIFITLFSEECILKEQLMVGYNSVDANGGVRCKLKLINDTLVESKLIESFKDKPETVKINYSYYLFNNKTINEVKLKTPSADRKFKNASLRILSVEELSGLTKHELDIMRNEIFADYGYRFKTGKWKKYFNNTKWYLPKHENVDKFLTIIEMINIELILKVSKKMNQ